MPGRFKYEKLAKYPHLKPEDVLIWERYINKYPNAFDSVDYDFAVGEGRPIPEGTQENIAADMKILTQKKIDVIGYKGEEIYIIEVKPTANTTALGQVISYAKLFQNQESPTEAIHMRVIAGNIDPDMQTIYDAQGIGVIIV